MDPPGGRILPAYCRGAGGGMRMYAGKMRARGSEGERDRERREEREIEREKRERERERAHPAYPRILSAYFPHMSHKLPAYPRILPAHMGRGSGAGPMY